ncbi:MAG TPA: hypothetical protein PKA05_14070 [Roseiflexaceae bacterium]|nr:hypothetical protein [Roseiflexaceae bacterium]HMP41503.1 hypothetical protein [Roseiflexaceae bacterium]
MSFEIVVCPVCKQKLGLQAYVLPGDDLVCANQHCGTTLRVESRRPTRIAIVPLEETYNADSRPESYG